VDCVADQPKIVGAVISDVQLQKCTNVSEFDFASLVSEVSM
jgi:hypothetical protein